MKLEDLKEGEIYFQKSEYKFIFRYRKTKSNDIGYGNYLEPDEHRFYRQSTCTNGRNMKEVRESTYQEKQWLIACEEAGQFVPLEEMPIIQEQISYYY